MVNFNETWDYHLDLMKRVLPQLVFPSFAFCLSPHGSHWPAPCELTVFPSHGLQSVISTELYVPAEQGSEIYYGL